MPPRSCPCGAPIFPTTKMVEWGKKHGKDFSVWPAKCINCVVDATIMLFESVEMDLPAALPAAPIASKLTCAHCSVVLGRHYYQDVPGASGTRDLCVECQTKWIDRGKIRDQENQE